MVRTAPIVDLILLNSASHSTPHTQLDFLICLILFDGRAANAYDIWAGASCQELNRFVVGLFRCPLLIVIDLGNLAVLIQL